MEQEAWLTVGKKVIQDFTENSTRLVPEKIELTVKEFVNFAFRIHLQLGFRLQEQRTTQPGYISASDNHRVFTHAGDYSQALKAESSAVWSRTETLREARALVLSQHYGELRKPTVIYSHPRQLCHTEDCRHCHGRGRVSCSGCSGSGKNSCHGCGGSGQVTEQRTHYDHYTKQNRYENVYVSCSSCYGSGKISCRQCGGSGHQSCSPCNGTGVLSEITRLQTVAVPDYQLVYFTGDVPQYIKDGLYKTGLPDLEQVGNITLLSNDIDEEHRQVKFLFDATVPFARLDSPLPQLHSADQVIHWIIYGSQPQILDSGHVVERMLKGDLDDLVRVSKNSRLLNPFIAGFSRKTLRTFMESESHQQMLQGNAKGLSGKLLSEKLSRSLSEPYIEESLTSLRSLSRAIQNWSVIKWIIFGSLFSWLLMPLFTAWNHAWFPDLETGRSYLTPFTRWDSQQHILISLEVLGRYCGVFVAAAGLMIPALGYGWRRFWARRRLGREWSLWSRAKGGVRHRWWLSLVAILLLSGVLLAVLPIWLTPSGALFNVVPFKTQALQILHFTGQR
ncbi:DnaJ-like cysteine-rich domain-containing protein [Tatumella morbirosei]|uniref:DnaJ-like cysteine-rich domain-containing protein n=1 Tax=Tatumella morbirosei TaxID=642227 RepID=UPI00062A3635|nr:hypothetical protein [Tatumella morbirosei]